MYAADWQASRVNVPLVLPSVVALYVVIRGRNDDDHPDGPSFACRPSVSAAMNLPRSAPGPVRDEPRQDTTWYSARQATTYFLHRDPYCVCREASMRHARSEEQGALRR